MAGLKFGPWAPPGPTQVPPAFGVPLSMEANWKTASELQTVMLLSIPALGAAVSETVTVEEAETQGGLPGTVYV